MEARRSIGEIEERKGANWERYTKYLREKAKNIIEERARAIYLTFLALGSEVSRPVSHHL
jgi:hypothetical protein